MFELAPGQDIRSLDITIQQQRAAFNQHAISAIAARDSYLKSVEGIERVFRTALLDADWLDQLQTPRYWAIYDMTEATARPFPLVEAEINRLDRWLAAFQRELARVMAEDGDCDPSKVRLVLDTSAVVRHHSFSDVCWPDYLSGRPVRLVIPILVVRQLDDLKDSGKAPKARSRLKKIRETLLGSGRGPAPLPQPNVTLELLMDPPAHSRLGNADEEIIRRTQYLQGRPGGPVQLVTGDYTMEFMAEADGVPVLFLPDELRSGGEKAERERDDPAE